MQIKNEKENKISGGFSGSGRLGLQRSLDPSFMVLVCRSKFPKVISSRRYCELCVSADRVQRGHLQKRSFLLGNVSCFSGSWANLAARITCSQCVPCVCVSEQWSEHFWFFAKESDTHLLRKLDLRTWFVNHLTCLPIRCAWFTVRGRVQKFITIWRLIVTTGILFGHVYCACVVVKNLAFRMQ